MQGKVSQELKDRLNAVLQQHLAERQIEAGKRHGEVNRQYYRRLIGIDLFNRFQEIEEIFDEFQREVSQMIEVERLSVEEAEAWLIERYEDGSLGRRQDRVSRRQFCDHFGIEYLRLIDIAFPSIAALLRRWDRKLRTEEYRQSPEAYRAYIVAASRSPSVKRNSLFVNRHCGQRTNVRERLKALLQRDYDAGELVSQRVGVISRTHYAELLACKSAGSLLHYIPEFKHFESLMGGEQMKFEDQLGEMENWTREQLLLGTIKAHRYMFDRGPFLERYGVAREIPRHIFHQSPLIRAMWKRIDDDIALGKLRSAVQEQKLARFREVLSRAPLNSDGLKINRVRLGQDSGVPGWEQRLPEYKELVREEEERRFAVMLQDPQRVYIKGKVFDFRPLVQQGWRNEVIAATRDAFFNAYREKNLSYLKGIKLAIFEVLSGLAAGISPSSTESFYCINERVNLTHSVWSAFLAEFEVQYVERVGNTKTEKKYIWGLNTVLQLLGNAGIFPKTDVIIGAKGGRSGHVKNFAEIAPEATLTPSEERPSAPSEPDGPETFEEHLAFARWRLLQLRRPGDETPQVEDEAFFDTLRAELRGANILVPKDPVQALVQILELRIANFEEPFTQEIKIWKAHYERGQTLLAAACLPEGYLDRIERPMPAGNARPFARSLFPLVERSEQGTANLLRYVMEQHNGLFPSPADCQLGSKFYVQLCSLYGGTAYLQAYLIPHRNAVGSCICLYLTASGANVAVARGLDVQAIEESDEPGFVRVTGSKARAKGKPIIVELRDNAFVVENMRWLAEELDIARFHATDSIDNLLFLRRAHSKIADATATWLYSWFSEFRNKDAYLCRYPITLNMIRPTILLLHALRNDGNLRIGLAYAQHGENVAGIYQIREATKYLYERKWREYMGNKETLIIHESAAALRLLDISETEKEIRIDQLMKTGLGSYCRTGGCDTMHCFACPSAALVADAEDMADLQIWNEALKESEGEWVRDRVERWEAEWLPWQCYTEVIAEKMQEGKAFRLLWREATKIAEVRKSQPDFVPPRPY
ncbi:hypothetical protein [Rhizobium leguminosarum]|uniref:hypothetical protein n=1 Tax=Rhizobium leguminosarum TaxID=384 RepID=UPI003F959239